MDETLRVKIVADVSQANSSLKSVVKETGQLNTQGNNATNAINQLNKSLSSLGFKTIRFNALKGIFNSVFNKKDIQNGVNSVKKGLNNVKKSIQDTKDIWEGFKIDKKFNIGNYDYFTGSNEFQNLAANINVSKDSIKELRKEMDKYINSKAGRSRHHLTQTKAFKEFAYQVKYGTTSLKEMEATWDRVFEGKQTRIMALGDSIKQTFSYIGNGIKGILSIIKSVLGAFLKLGLALAALAIIPIKLANSVSKLGNEIDKSSQKVGMSTNTYQKWAYILERCGVEASQLQTAMSQLVRNSASNKEKFSTLGIDVEGLTSTEMFEKTVEALQNISDQAERARVASQLFGRSYAELGPVLNITADEVKRLTYQYELLGATMDGRVIRASVNMRDAIQDMKAAWQGLKNTLAQYIIPILTKIIIRITVFIAKVNMVLKELFGVDIEYTNIEETTASVASNIDDSVAAVKKLRTLIAGFDELNIFPSQDSGGGTLGGLADDLGDLAGIGTPVIGEILPPEAIAELEYFRDNVLPGIVKDFEDLKQVWQDIKDIFADIEYTLSGQKWQDAFDNGTIGDLTFWDMLGDTIGDIIDGIWDMMNLDGKGGIKELFKDWFNVDIDWDNLTDDNFFDEWWNAVINGTDTEIGLREMDGFRELFNFFDWIDENLLGGNGLFGLEKIESFDDMFTFEGMFGTFDWKSSGIYKFAQWIGNTQFWQDFKHNIDPNYWWNGNDGEVIGLKQMLGIDKIEEWGIWKKSWWEEKWAAVKKPFEDAWTSVSGYWKTNIAPKFTKKWWEEKFKSIKEGWENTKVGGALTAAWNGIVTWFNQSVKPKFTKEYWTTKWNGIKEGWNSSAIGQALQGNWDGIKQWFQQSVGKYFTKQFWKDKWQSILHGFQNTKVGSFLNEKWISIKKWWDENISPKFTIDYWKNKWLTISTGLSWAGLKTKISEKWTEIKNWWSENISPKFTWSYWKARWSNIVETLASIDLGNAAKKMMNGFLTAIENGVNKAIRAINNSGLMRFIGWSIGEVSIPKFQTYAQGGVIDKPTFGLMGEYPGAHSNPEIITPENKLTNIFENSNNDIVNVLLQGFRQIIQAIDEKDTSVNIGDTEVAKAAARGNNKYRLQTGQSLI